MNTINYNAFAGLFFVASFGRGMLLSLLPLQALERLGSAQLVSGLYFAASIAGILSSLCIPYLVRLGGSYRVFLAGALALLASAGLLGAPVRSVFIAGMLLHVFAVAAMDVTLSLYVMQRIPRKELTRFEPKRVLSSVLALSIGPWLGVYLESRVMHWLPYYLTIGAALLAILYFRLLGLHRDRLRESQTRSVNPLRHIRRYFSQPRLRLAWWLTVARSSWWAVFIIYTPIYAERSGQGELIGAAVISIGTAWSLTIPLWGWVGRTYGVRRLTFAGFVATALVMTAVFLYRDDPRTVMGLLVMAALGATVIDGAGNVLFMRAVRSWERSEMTGVFLTYRDASQLAPPGLFTVLLQFFALPVVFISAAAWMFLAAGFCRFIPKRM